MKHSNQLKMLFIIHYLLKIPLLPTADYNRNDYADVSKSISNGHNKRTTIWDLNCWFLLLQVGNQLRFNFLKKMKEEIFMRYRTRETE